MDISKNRIAVRVWGEMALFSRPEMKVERVSYDVMTPSAARGIIEAIYWKPEIRWVVDRIRVLSPIRFTNIRRNELGGRGPSARTLKAYMEGRNSAPISQNIEDDRQQRAATALRDVDYLVEAHYEVLDNSQPPQKHYEIFKRRSEKGQCFHRPYFGCREFTVNFKWHDGEPLPGHPSLAGERDLGWMLLDIDFEDKMTPRFFQAKMVDGVVEVPAMSAKEVKA